MDSSHRKKIIEILDEDSETLRVDNDIEIFRKKVEASPHDPDALFMLGTLYLRRDRMADAISMFEQCLAHDPGRMEAFFLLGNSYIRYDQYELAARYYLKALKLNPNHGPTLYNIGLCYIELGLRDKAINALKKFYIVEETVQWKEEAKYQLYKLGVHV